MTGKQNTLRTGIHRSGPALIPRWPPGGCALRRGARAVLLYLSCGLVATTAGAAGSLLVDGVTAKRVVWIATGVVFAVAAGLAHALSRPLVGQAPTGTYAEGTSPSSSADRPPGPIPRLEADMIAKLAEWVARVSWTLEERWGRHVTQRDFYRRLDACLLAPQPQWPTAAERAELEQRIAERLARPEEDRPHPH